MNTVARFSLGLSKAPATRRSLLLPTVTTTRSATTTSNKSTDQNSSGNDSMENVKSRLARAALKQVPRYGWTQDAISIAASEDPKLSLSMSGMLSPSELVGWFMDDMNRQLRTQKKEKTKNDDENDNDNARQFEAIQWRLEQVLPFVKSGQWHRGMAMGLSTPLTTQSQLHEFIELISPDNCSTAYQTALGAIFVATELHLLTDDSPNYIDTWMFLRNRLNELESHRREYGDVDPSQFMVQLASSAPIPSVSSLANMTNSIPVVAGLAVAQSLVEGAASLVFPPSFHSLSPNMTEQPQDMSGTKASDYKSPPPPSTRNQN